MLQRVIEMRMAQALTPIIDVRGARKSYPTPAGEFTALKGVDFQISQGEFVAIVGRSGSGKSTLLNLLTGIDRPTAGGINIAGTAILELDEQALARWRGRNVGVVFQFFQLIPTLTIVENVMLPMDFCNTYPPALRRPRALELLELVKIAEQAHKLPSALSGGQQQRAAIARALANDPVIIVADEPTGNLDTQTAAEILRLFQQLADNGKTLVVVTHDKDIARLAGRVITLDDGWIVPAGRGMASVSKGQLQEASYAGH